MSIADALVGEFTHEASVTRKLLERLPEDKLAWKPHEKSMSLGRLASHLAEIPEWGGTIVNDDVFDMDASDYSPKELTSRQAVLDAFDQSGEAFKKQLAGVSDEKLHEIWKMKQGGNVVVEMPRIACLRGFIMSHAVHHRGQLSVYLRENDVPIPSIYGPSADESM